MARHFESVSWWWIRDEFSPKSVTVEHAPLLERCALLHEVRAAPGPLEVGGPVDLAVLAVRPELGGRKGENLECDFERK